MSEILPKTLTAAAGCEIVRQTDKHDNGHENMDRERETRVCAHTEREREREMEGP